MASPSAKPKKNGSAEGQTAEAPLFVKNPKLLSTASHAKAGIKRMTGFPFAIDTNSAPITSVEFFEVARSYPIVFSGQTVAAPIAILGLEQKNLFVDEEGVWKSGYYIPGYVRQYPFLLFRNPESGDITLCIDEAAEAFAAKNPDMPFYTDEGKPTEFSNKAMEFCVSFYQQHLGTLEFVKALQQQNLLTPRQTNITLPSGRKLALNGFLSIDEERYQALPDKVYNEWRKKGWTLLADAAILSAVNWKYLAQLTTP